MRSRWRSSAKVWPEYLKRCQPPTGAKEIGDELATRDDGGWNATLLWELGDQCHKLSTHVDPSGHVTLPEGCGK